MPLSASKCSPLSCILNSLAVKPALEKHLLEEAGGAETQRLLQIGKLKIWDHNFMYPFCKVKKFEFWRAPFGETFFFIFAYPKNFMCFARVVKKFKFWRASLGETSIVARPIFVTFSLFLISTHFKNLIHLSLTV